MSENTTTIEENTAAQEKEPPQTAAPEPQTESEVKISEKKPLFHFRTKDSAPFSRDEWILQNLKSEDLMEYLKLEQHRMELLQEAKDVRANES